MRGRSSLGVAWLVCVCAISVSAPAMGDDARAAKKAFRDATALYEKGEYAEAADEFKRAYELKPSWKLLYNIGQSEAAAKRHGIALETFEKYLAEGGDDIKKKRQKEVREEIKRLRDMVGSLDVRSPDGAVITVDGVERGVAPLAGHVLVAAGVSHHVAVTLEGEPVFEKAVKVTGGQVMVVEEEPEVVATTPSDEGSMTETEEGDGSALPADEGSRPLRTAGWITLGVGAAALIGGAVTGGMALSKNAELEDSCDGTSCGALVDPELEEKRDNLALATDILLPAGGVIAGAGLILLIVDAAKGKSEKAGEAEANARVLPMLGTRGAGVVLERRF